VGEAWAWELPDWFSYYGAGDELQLLFNFRLLDAPFEARALRGLFERIDEAAPAGTPPPAVVGSNHDVVRFPTRWCDGDPQRVRCALLVLLGLPGTPFLYYGDEIGMPSAHVPPERELDCASPSRDPARTPMQWADEPGAGFTAAGVEPWLPFGDLASCNVAAQRDDPHSVLGFCRDAIALRRSRPELRSGGYESLATAEGVWAWRRGEGTAIAVNLSDAETELALEGDVLLATDRSGEGEAFVGRLGPWSGVIVSTRGSG
jgi:alpha-glucosidase